MKRSNYEDQDDLQLVNAFKAGDDKAFELLMERHSSLIDYFLRSKLGIYSNYLKDCYQNVCLKAWNSLQKNDFQPPFNFKGWVATISVNEATDQWKTCERKKILSIERWEDTGTFVYNPEVILRKNEILQFILDAINQLSETQKVVVQLKLNGYDYEKIAETTNTDVLTCRGQFFRGVRKLRADPVLQELYFSNNPAHENN